MRQAEFTWCGVQPTSRESWRALQPTLGRCQSEVLEIIRAHGPVTNLEISELWNRAINQVTGRVHELRRLGLVESAGIRFCTRTNRSAIAWKAT